MTGVTLKSLPWVNVVLISHSRYDHFDVPTLHQLEARRRPRVIVPIGNQGLVRACMPNSTVSKHDWGSTVTFAGMATVHFEPMLYGSGRTSLDQQRTL